jgi:Zn-dependent M32 family carboxypeptidase
VLLHWLRTHIHCLGQTHRPAELITLATGRPPTPGPLLSYLEERVAFIESA